MFDIGIQKWMVESKLNVILDVPNCPTTKFVDRILVFENGKIVEDENHEELMQSSGHYAEMYHEQENMFPYTLNRSRY